MQQLRRQIYQQYVVHINKTLEKTAPLYIFLSGAGRLVACSQLLVVGTLVRPTKFRESHATPKNFTSLPCSALMVNTLSVGWSLNLGKAIMSCGLQSA